MDTTSSKRLVLISALAMTVISVYRANQGETQVYKRLWGTGVLWLVLSFAADIAPQIAGPFSVLVVLGMLTNGGDKAIQNLLSSTSTKVP